MSDPNTWEDLPTREVGDDPRPLPETEDWDENPYPMLVDVYGEASPSVEAYQELREMIRRQAIKMPTQGPRTYGRRCE